MLGHVTKDILESGKAAPGGTATYSAITAQRLGLQTAVLTACAAEDSWLLDALREAGIWVHVLASPHTTTYRNIYDPEGRRTQLIGGQAGSIEYEDVPQAWRRASIVHLGPVAQELDSGMPAMFGDCLLGVTPQGWMRSWQGEGSIMHSAWPLPNALRNLPDNAFLVLSVEDLGYDPRIVKSYAHLAPLVAVTHGEDDAHIYRRAERVAVPACHAKIVDLTGAGDVFATALFIRYKETGDLIHAARFAHAAAALSIEAPGISGIAGRSEVEKRMEDET